MVLQCKFEEIGLFIYTTAILNPEGCKLAFCAWVKSTASQAGGGFDVGEQRTKPNHLNISERQRNLMRRERKI